MQNTSKLRPLPWYGGKAGYGKAKWIAGLLPWRKESTYVETHGGMFGVGLARQPVKVEIFNDLDSRVVNWWSVLRTEPKRFGWAVQCLPQSREEHAKARDMVDDSAMSDFDRALAFHCLALQSMMLNLNGKPSWMVRPSVNGPGSLGRWREDRVELLAERMWNVQLENCSGDVLLKRLQNEEKAIIYVDPPYVGKADTSAYYVCEVNVDFLSDLLLAQTGAVAVSGYENSWDHLNWQVEEKETIWRSHSGAKMGKASRRVERLWRNNRCVDEANCGSDLDFAFNFKERS